MSTQLRKIICTIFYSASCLLLDEVDAVHLPINGSVEEHMEGIDKLFNSTP